MVMNFLIDFALCVCVQSIDERLTRGVSETLQVK